MGKAITQMFRPSVIVPTILAFICAVGAGFCTRMAVEAVTPNWEQNYALGALLCGVAMIAGFAISFINLVLRDSHKVFTTPLQPIK